VSVDGYVGETYDDTVGSHVKKNQRLAVIHSQEFVSASTACIGAIERELAGAGEDTAAKVKALAALKTTVVGKC